MYVDRDYTSIECISLLLALKIKYLHHYISFEEVKNEPMLTECLDYMQILKGSTELNKWKCLNDTFNCLPLAAVIDDRIFCVAGGFPHQSKSIEDINLIKRPIDGGEEIVMEITTNEPINGVEGFQAKGNGFYLGEDEVEKYLEKNEMKMMCRGRSVNDQGYQCSVRRKVVSIFTSPRFLCVFRNPGVILKVDDGTEYEMIFIMNALKSKKKLKKLKVEK